MLRGKKERNLEGEGGRVKGKKGKERSGSLGNIEDLLKKGSWRKKMKRRAGRLLREAIK